VTDLGSRADAPALPELPPDAAALLRPRLPTGLPLPAYDGRSLPNLTRTVVETLGAEAPTAALAPLAGSVDPFGGRRAEGPVLLFVVDGLGYNRLRLSAARSRGAGATAWQRRSVPLTSVFPTTTTVALASLSTASSPSRHGVVGYRQFLPRYGSVVDMLRLSPHGVPLDDALVGPTWSPELVLGTPTIFRAAVRGAVAVSRDRFEARGFTRTIYDGARYVPYAAGSDLAAALVRVLGRSDPPPLVTGYWDELDTVQHLRGPADPAADLELERVAGLLDFVARSVEPSVARRTTVLVTADHGLVPAEPSRQTAFDAEPTIVAELGRPPTGDRRVGLLKARSGAVERLRAALVARVPGGTVLDAEEAVRTGLFGPPPYHPDLAETVADLVVLVPSPGGITYLLPGRPPSSRQIVGAHGGLEPDELLVPLVAGPLVDFRLPPDRPGPTPPGPAENR
jgi:hypothetical protein